MSIACPGVGSDRPRDAAAEICAVGVIARPLLNYGLPEHLRISTGTAEQNERLLAAMAAALAVRA